MPQAITKIISITLGIWLIDYLLPQIAVGGGWWMYFLIGLGVWLIHEIFYKPISLILTPIKIITFGIGGFIIALVFTIVAILIITTLVPIMLISGVLGTIIFAISLIIVVWISDKIS